MISESSNNLFTFSNNDEIIFSDEQKKTCLSWFFLVTKNQIIFYNIM